MKVEYWSPPEQYATIGGKVVELLNQHQSIHLKLSEQKSILEVCAEGAFYNCEVSLCNKIYNTFKDEPNFSCCLILLFRVVLLDRAYFNQQLKGLILQ